MKKILFAGVAFALVPFVSFAQVAESTDMPVAPVAAAVTTVDPGLIPGDFFYFLDRWSEKVSTAFTFNKEKKARKHLEYAKERVAEMKDVLKKPEAKLADIASAKDDFDMQISEVATLVKGEKDKGSNVSKLARDLSDDLDVSLGELKDIFREHQDNQGRAESVIRAKLGTLTNTEASQLKGLLEALNAIIKEKTDAKEEEDSLDAEHSDEQALFEEVMGAQMAAQKHLERAMRPMIPGQVPPQATEQLMKQAQEAMQRGDFETAKQMSKEAERVIEMIKDLGMGPSSGVPATRMIDGVEVEDMGENSLDSLDREMGESERAVETLSR